jgi:hypothetical protein
MNTKNTWLLLSIAVLLGGFIFGWEKYIAGPARQPALVLPGLEPSRVTAIQLRVSGQAELLAERTNGGWHLSKPIPYPAQPQRIELFLRQLQELHPSGTFTAQDLQQYPEAEKDFGFDNPLATVDLFTGKERRQLILGARTAPGEHVYVQVVGRPGVHLVTAKLLEAVPQSVGVWRETALLDWVHLDFDRVLIANGTRTTELLHDTTNGLWRLPRLQARADGFLIEELLKRLRATQIQKFVTDAAGTDLEAYGLRSPELTLSFLRGTNLAARLNFGKSPTNDAKLVYARRSGLDSVLTVPAEPLAPWRAPAAEFRDRFLVNLKLVPARIEVIADDTFTLVRQTNQLWRVEPGGFLADTNYMNEVLLTFARMQIVAFEKDVVTEPDLPKYGLATPFRQFVLKGTNGTLAHLSFGTNIADRILVKRADEDSVYAVATAEFNRLPAASWELRDRHIWSFNLDDVVRVSVEREGQVQNLLRQGTNSWTLGDSSRGAINVFGVEETVARLANLRAAFWTVRQPEDLKRFGFTEPAFRLSVLLRDGKKHEVRFGGEAANQFPFALFRLNGEDWVGEFPWDIYQLIQTYLCPPTP